MDTHKYENFGFSLAGTWQEGMSYRYYLYPLSFLTLDFFFFKFDKHIYQEGIT